MPVDEVKARLALPDLPAEGSYHTVAGLVLALLQRVPQVGDWIVFGGWLFKVLEIEGRRVARAGGFLWARGWGGPAARRGHAGGA